MCELLGMNANMPTDILMSLKALAKRGSDGSPHRDGWGIAFYEDADVQIFRDPACIADSAIANLLQNHPIKSQTVIAHIRHANVGKVSLPNTHPFTRELWGQHWTFAHNGQLQGFTSTPGFYNPVGETDSESIFCDLLNQLRLQFENRAHHERVIPFIAAACARYRAQGPLNCLISNSEWLFAYCSTKLASVTRRMRLPGHHDIVGEGADTKATMATSETVATVVATEPLTPNEAWTPLEAGQWKLWRQGALLAEGHTN